MIRKITNAASNYKLGRIMIHITLMIIGPASIGWHFHGIMREFTR